MLLDANSAWRALRGTPLRRRHCAAPLWPPARRWMRSAIFSGVHPRFGPRRGTERLENSRCRLGVMMNGEHFWRLEHLSDGCSSACRACCARSDVRWRSSSLTSVKSKSAACIWPALTARCFRIVSSTGICAPRSGRARLSAVVSGIRAARIGPRQAGSAFGGTSWPSAFRPGDAASWCTFVRCPEVPPSAV